MTDRDTEVGEVDVLAVVIGGGVEHGSILHDPTPKPLDLMVEAGLGDATRVLTLLDGTQEPFAYLSKQYGVDVAVRVEGVGCGTGGERQRGLPQLVIPLDPVKIELLNVLLLQALCQLDDVGVEVVHEANLERGR